MLFIELYKAIFNQTCMHNRNIDYECLRQENFQLKNEITDLKNGFDLNRDVLKILEEQVKETNPKCLLFYQIISRLTGINNQVMLANVDLVQEKSQLFTSKRKMENTIDKLNERIKQLMEAKPASPNEIVFQMQQEIKGLNTEILALHEECLRKNVEIAHLTQLLTSEEHSQMKKPMIPSVKVAVHQKKEAKGNCTQRSSIHDIPIRNEPDEEIRFKILNRNLKNENRRLRKLIEELEYRLTLLTGIYRVEPEEKMQQVMKSAEQQGRKMSQNQLSLLLFALQNTSLEEEEEDADTVKVTMTKRCQGLMETSKQVTRTSSTPDLKPLA